MFEAGIRKLDPRGTFEMDELEIDHLLSTFNPDGSGTIELDSFMTFCLSIPSLPWRAEKVRRSDEQIYDHIEKCLRTNVQNFTELAYKQAFFSGIESGPLSTIIAFGDFATN